MLALTEDGFTLHGKPFRLISGALHYFRVHPDQWADRLRKARLMGLNTIDTYVPWNLHEPRRGEWHWDGIADLPRFLDLAAAEGLHVLLRPGPYICAEWDGGGLPAWLLAEPDIRLRTTDPRFLAAVADYFAELLPKVRPHLGGPVLAVQVENEYGAYGEDTAYLEAVAGMLRAGGVNLPLFTCDQPGDLVKGALPGVLATATFGSRATEALTRLREVQPSGPLVCAEFWDGWFDRWGGVHRTRTAGDAASTLDELLGAGASVSIYLFHGGTNFGFTNGANDKGTYRPTVTSYDYDAPLDEAGDPAPKYHAFREVIARYAPVPDEPVPAPGRKLSVPEIQLTESVSLLDSVAALGGGRRFLTPPTMEELGQASGFTLYETVLAQDGPITLEVSEFGDRVQAFLDGQPVGVLERENHEHTLRCRVRPGAVLALLVENQGRVNYGPGIHDRKGLLGPVRANGTELLGWTAHPLELTELSGLDFTDEPPGLGPVFHRGTLELAEPADTFLALAGWTKGNAWVNGFPLGRYWSRGPQRTLYVPAPVLRPGRNEIVVLELHATRAPVVALREHPDLGELEE
ncbi:beta-galactosidase [Crossiella sp. CA-258035]|uniref:glycoside hydrolase family 35 protein n=1 Tax=Crossiella sp. CA-258035 TaxID=2981138 RepID=UPI0024BC8333|nr:beta-galactosidase [Crossiella sp. CA-258035]WHT16377.1 beta-galactosidase [Crossiella sp. CA-258035]